jgi:hypothetical protein
MNDTSVAPPAPERLPTYGQHAREICGLGPDWIMSAWDASKPGFLIVTGAVCRERISAGPRAGQPDWDKRDKDTEIPVTFSDAQHKAWLLAWEAETGKCHLCSGNGLEWCGWNCETGDRFRPCSRCGATGATPAPAAA